MAVIPSGPLWNQNYLRCRTLPKIPCNLLHVETTWPVMVYGATVGSCQFANHNADNNTKLHTSTLERERVRCN